MKRLKVLLPSIKDVKDFVSIVSKFECGVRVISSGTSIDAKSILGIFSLRLNKPIEIIIMSDDDNYEKAISAFSVKE